jgi:hypothetical protein
MERFAEVFPVILHYLRGLKLGFYFLIESPLKVFLLGPSLKKAQNSGSIRPVDNFFPDLQSVGTLHGGSQTRCFVNTFKTRLRRVS